MSPWQDLTDSVWGCIGQQADSCCGWLQLTGGVSKGLAMMTMDQEYVNRFRIQPTTLRTRLIQGLQAAGIGVYEGVLGQFLWVTPSPSAANSYQPLRNCAAVLLTPGGN